MGWTRRIPIIGKFKDRDRKTKNDLSTLLLAILAGFIFYSFALHPAYSPSLLDTYSSGSSYFYVYGGEAKYTAVAVRSMGGRKPLNAGYLPHSSTSEAHPDADVAADTAWVAAMGHWGCSADFEADNYQLYPGFPDSDVPIARLEGKELAAPPVGKGLSIGLTFTLAQASIISGFVPDVAVAATGIVDRYGSVLPIGGVRYKIEAALASGAEVFYVPEGNFEQAERFTPDGLRLVPVSSVSEVFADLGFPTAIDCGEAELR